VRSCPSFLLGFFHVASFDTRNRVLMSLTERDLALLQAHFEYVELPVRFRIETPNKPISHVYFVERGIVSVVTTGPKRLPIEVAVVGYEGFTGVAVVLGGDRSPLDTYVQVAGQGYRIDVDALQRAIADSPTLANLLNRFSQAFITQISQTALANGRAKLEERLARWLLMAQDRLQSDDLPLTHEFLALMLAVRRPGVTVELSKLQVQGLLRVRRGAITIEDRQGLLKIATNFTAFPKRSWTGFWRFESKAARARARAVR